MYFQYIFQREQLKRRQKLNQIDKYGIFEQHKTLFVSVWSCILSRLGRVHVTHLFRCVGHLYLRSQLLLRASDIHPSVPKGSGPHLFLADKALGRLTLSLHRLVSSVRPGYITVTLAAPNVKRNKKGGNGGNL